MHKKNNNNKDIVVLIPCHNEELTIEKVISGFRKELPTARIVVYDNASTDKSKEQILNSGAEYFYEKRLGKATVVRRMLNDIDAQLYILVDGDDTYSAVDVHTMIEAVSSDKCDMAVGRRRSDDKKAMKFVNKLGNIFFSRVMSSYFRTELRDILSGYRVFSRKLVDQLNIVSFEFEIEAEMTIQALSKGFVIEEIDVCYKPRIDGSISKLNVIKDGWMILNTMLALFRDLKPLTFFMLIAFLIWILSLVYGIVVWRIERVASLLDILILFCSFFTGCMLMVVGIVLHTVDRRFYEMSSLFKRNQS